MDVFALMGYNRVVGQMMNDDLYRLFVCHGYKLRRADAVCKNEIEAMLNPAVDPVEGRMRYPRLCGTYLARLRSSFDMDVEKLNDLPMSVLPYLARIIKGTQFLKKHMDVSAFTGEDVPALMEFFGLSSEFLLPEPMFGFREEGAMELAKRVEARRS